MTTKCIVCKKEFEGKRKTLFCSDECSEKYKNDDDVLVIKENRTKLIVDSVGIKEKPSDKVSEKIRDFMDKINKDFGAGTVMNLGEKPIGKVDVVSTGSIQLDNALGIGGLPRGRMVEIYGMESSGKTTIALHVIANAQKQGLKCFLIDAENSFDPEYAYNLDVDIDKMEYCQPSCGEQGLEAADRAVCTGEYGVVVIDSVAALIPKAELEGQSGDNKMGLHARLMSQACRKMVGTVAKTNTLVIFINQLRSKIGLVFGSPDVTTGGMALQFYASVRLDVRKSAIIKDGEVLVGNKTRVKVAKNKCAPPMKTIEFDVIYGEGIDRNGEIIDYAVEKGIMERKGSWFSYNGTQIGQGREQVRQLLKDTPELVLELEEKIKAQSS